MRCAMCGGEQSRDKSCCWRCEARIRQEAAEEQERRYMAQWLSTRLDEFGNVLESVPTAEQRTVRRIAKLARRSKVDWTTLQEPLTFDMHMRNIAATYGVAMGRGRKKAS